MKSSWLRMKRRTASDYRDSAGLLLNDDGAVVDVIHGSAAYHAEINNEIARR